MSFEVNPPRPTSAEEPEEMATTKLKKRAGRKPSRTSSPEAETKTKRVVCRLKYRSARDKKWLKHESIRLHPAALSMPMLEREAYRVLKRSIVPKGRPVHLTTPIVITSDGLIVDGRHRARALVEAGHGDELTAQIAARQGEWVELLPEGENPYLYAAKIQQGRRNCPSWRIAWAALPEYEKAVEEGNRLRGRSRSVKGAKSPVDAFCSEIGISKAVFNRALRVRRSAHPDDIAALESGRVSLNAIVRKLDAAEKKRQTACGSESPQRDDASVDGDSAKSRKRRSSSNAASDGGRSLEAERKLIAERLNHLLRGHAGETAAAIAQALLASLDEPIKQLIIDAVYGATATQPTRGVVPDAGHNGPA